MLHQVNKLQFEATCATEAQAFELRHNFSLARQDEIAAIIDKVCSQYVREDEWMQIDRIEVELEHFSLHAFENIFTSLLQEKLEKAISKKINAIPAAKRTASKQTAYLGILVYFLQTGTLPWWADEAISMDTIFIEVVQKKKEALSRFLQQHKMNSIIWKRIAMQFNDSVEEQIFSFFPELVLAKEKAAQWIALLTEKKINKGFEAILSNNTKKKRDEFILFHAPQFFMAAEQNNIAVQLIEAFAMEFKSIAYEGIPVSAIIDKIIAHEKTETKLSAGELNKAIEAKEQLHEINDFTEITIAEKFTVHTAGTVLLAPYFKQLFMQLNLLQQDEWTNAQANYKAIHLIRYMATGQLMCAEHELVMEKLLCGMGITAPIPREVILSDEEKNEATELLKAVITHWSKLKNTSVEGLRETFLKREGILTKKDNGWLLRVERKTADVLLESIPWGYSTLAFSWNNYIIFTEW